MGIGGVIVVPALILCKVPPELAIVTVFVSFQPATWMKLLLVGRLEGLIAWRTALPAAVMATIGSATGGMFVTRAPRRILAFSVASFALFAALVDVFKFVRAWRERQAAGQNANTTQGTADAPGQEHVEGVPKDGSLAGGSCSSFVYSTMRSTDVIRFSTLLLGLFIMGSCFGVMVVF